MFGKKKEPEKPRRKIDEISDMFKITISNGTHTVEAPLHEDFGFTVGSEYTTPFDIGTMSGMLQKTMAVAGVSAPVGLRMRKMYANPEPVEISFRMEFDAYYDAHAEVVIPTATLAAMGLGREMTGEDINDKLEMIGGVVDKMTAGVVNPTVPSEVDTSEGGASSKLLGMIKMINAPPVCTLKFGKVLHIEDVFITSTAVSYSNVLDQKGNPTSATVNVTCTLQIAPIAEDVIKMYGRGYL